jgi:hypothetical protein
MHADGGTIAQVFVYPFELSLHKLDAQHHVVRKRRLFIIRNSKLFSDWSTVDNKVEAIAARSVDVLIRSQGIGDLYRIYTVSGQDEVDYNLTYITDDFKDAPKELFDRAYMNKLFDYGYALAKGGISWKKEPPGWVESSKQRTGE